jgi:hypothetical protein
LLIYLSIFYSGYDQRHPLRLPRKLALTWTFPCLFTQPGSNSIPYKSLINQQKMTMFT